MKCKQRIVAGGAVVLLCGLSAFTVSKHQHSAALNLHPAESCSMFGNSPDAGPEPNASVRGPKDKYILPFLCATLACYDDKPEYFFGPNNQFKAFRIAATVAIKMDRVLVLPEFASHPHDHMDGSGAKIRHWVNLSDVYDLKQINTKLKTMSIREFVQTTKKVDITIASMQKKWARKVSAGDVMKRWGISSKNLDVGTKTSWAHVKEVTSKAKYVAMRFDHFGSPIQNESWWCDAYKSTAQVIRPAPCVRQRAQQFISKFFGKRKFLAVQIRLADFCNINDFQQCYHNIPWTDLWKVIVWQAKALGTSNVFIAAPPKFHKVANVTFGDMNVITLDAEKQRYLELPANFHASLVEQEICVQADDFLFSRASAMCYSKHKCKAGFDYENWFLDRRNLVTRCCKDGVMDGRVYGESLAGNIAEMRWARLSKTSTHMPPLFGKLGLGEMLWQPGEGARHCMLGGKNKIKMLNGAM